MGQDIGIRRRGIERELCARRYAAAGKRLTITKKMRRNNENRIMKKNNQIIQAPVLCPRYYQLHREADNHTN